MEENKIIIYNTDDGKASVSLMAKDGTVWMNQKQMAELFATTKQNISLHTQNILKEGELDELSVVKEYLPTDLTSSRSNIYKSNRVIYSTPTGSYFFDYIASYKHIIPSGFENSNKNQIKLINYE